MIKVEGKHASTLLYLETCATDIGGRLNPRRMNDDDWDAIEVWSDSGLLKCLPRGRVVLSDELFAEAHRLRLERARRLEKEGVK